MEISDSTDPESLVGNTYTTEHGEDPFKVVTADQAPALRALAYGAMTQPTNLHSGYPFVAFAPWGSTMNEEQV